MKYKPFEYWNEYYCWLCDHDWEEIADAQYQRECPKCRAENWPIKSSDYDGSEE